jgi:hypothetical protein
MGRAAGTQAGPVGGQVRDSMVKLTRTTIHMSSRGSTCEVPAGMRAGVSLHAHSECSREKLDFIPGIARRIPLVRTLFDLGVARYQRENGRALDFGSFYWRPPLTPAAVVASERDQIAARFDLPGLVSMSDHDTVEGPRRMRASGALDTPLSVEWSVPSEEAMFHLGVHAIDPARLDTTERLLAAYTGGAREPRLEELLDWLGQSPETFVVLNHPCWDMLGVGAMRHEAILLRFMRAHRQRIHALEINGYRRWSENRRVLPLAEGFGLPVVGGGDRHGRLPNAIINLTPAATLAEFAAELRAGRPTDCVVFPEYWDPFAARVLQGARDALGYDRTHHAGRKAWSDRVFFQASGGERPLSSIWPNGAPFWVRGSVRVTRLLGSQPLQPLFRLALSDE